MKKLKTNKTNSPVYCIRVDYKDQNVTEGLYVDILQTAALWVIAMIALVYIFTL